MASSTRRKAIELWRTNIPSGDPEALANLLFCYDNPPGTKEYSGSQDALGIVMPGLNRLYYSGDYWPSEIESIQDDSLLSWIEDRLYIVNLGPRSGAYHALGEQHINRESARALSMAADQCWEGICKQDTRQFGEAFRASFEAQTRMFPRMLEGGIRDVITRYKDSAAGWKLSGAGGGGYLILVSQEEIPHAIRVKIRRQST